MRLVFKAGDLNSMVDIANSTICFRVNLPELPADPNQGCRNAPYFNNNDVANIFQV